MENVSAESASEAGFYIQNVGGLQGCPGCESAGSARGLVIAPGNKEIVDGVLWNGSFLDGSDTAGLLIAPTGTGRVSQLQLVNLRPAFTQNGPGVLIDTTGGGVVNGILSTNLNAGPNSEEGVKILGSNTKQIHFVNSRLSCNNTSNTGKSGAYVGSGVSNVTFIGGCSSTCSLQHPSTVNRQTYGLEFASGASNYVVQGMDLTGNVTGPILNTSTNVGWSIINNPGYNQNTISGELRVNLADGSPFHGRILDDGNFHVQAVSGPLWLDAPSGVSIYQTINGTGIVQTTATEFRPSTHNATALGTSGARWSEVFGVNGFFSGTLAVVDQTLDGKLIGAEIPTPAAPAANHGVIYFDDNGAGKTRLMVRFPTGAAQQVAIEP